MNRNDAKQGYGYAEGVFNEVTRPRLNLTNSITTLIGPPPPRTPVIRVLAFVGGPYKEPGNRAGVTVVDPVYNRVIRRG